MRRAAREVIDPRPHARLLCLAGKPRLDGDRRTSLAARAIGSLPLFVVFARTSYLEQIPRCRPDRVRALRPVTSRPLLGGDSSAGGDPGVVADGCRGRSLQRTDSRRPRESPPCAEVRTRSDGFVAHRRTLAVKLPNLARASQTERGEPSSSPDGCARAKQGLHDVCGPAGTGGRGR